MNLTLTLIPNPLSARSWLPRVLVLSALVVLPAFGKNGNDPIAMMFPPELVMQNRSELNLTDKQRTAFLSLVKEFQSEVVEIEWDLQDARGDLAKALATRPISPQEATRAIDDMLTRESNIKKRHVLLLVAIKNLLNDQQVPLLEQKAAVFRQKVSTRKNEMPQRKHN